MHRRLVAWATVLGFWATSQVGHAQESPAELERARELFGEAVELHERELWGRAAAKYREAATIKDTPGLRFRAGYCEARRLRLLEAKREYARARALLERHPAAEDVKRLLPQAMTRLEARIPTLRVTVPQSVQGIEFNVDARRLPVGRLGKRVALNPGVHTVLLRTSAGQEFRRKVVLGDGDHLSVVAQLSTVAPPARARRDEAVGQRPNTQVTGPAKNWRSVGVITGAGLAVVGLGAGLTLVWQGRSAERRYHRHARALDDDACSKPPAELGARCNSLQEALTDQQRARARAGWAFAAAGTGAAIALTTTWLGSGNNVTTSATFTPTSATLSFRGSL